jgi:hypothetical protein
MKEIKELTFAQACKLEGMDGKKVMASLNQYFDFFDKKEKAAHVAHAICTIMIKAANRIVNDGKPWKADHKNHQQIKYEARWYNDGGSSGFRFDDFVRWHSGSAVGSRLCFKSYDALYALCMNKEFIKFWNRYAL